MMCVSHDRYFLDKVARRLLVLDPPSLQDFSGNYTEWNRRQSQAQQASRAASETASAKPKAAAKGLAPRRPAPSGSGSPNARKDNPYSRPFGKLTIKELEIEITETEVALSDCQQGFAGAKSDAGRHPAAAGGIRQTGKKAGSSGSRVFYAREMSQIGNRVVTVALVNISPVTAVVGVERNFRPSLE